MVARRSEDRVRLDSGQRSRDPLHLGDERRRLERARPHTRLTGEYPAWSPDGKRIAFATNQPVSENGFDIVLADADGSSPHRITRNDLYEMGPSWSPDGRWIAFYAGNGGRHDIYVMRPDGSKRRRLTHDGGELPSWSPDGR